jgi:hypothetical protein
VLASGCGGPPGGGRQLGEALGTFHVEASETQNSCGSGALGSAGSFEFDVALSRAATELFWDGRVGGHIEPSLQFSFSADVLVVVRPPGPGGGCSMRRTDGIQGVLEDDGAGGVGAFTGQLDYAFAVDASTDCGADDLIAQGLSHLPCDMQYELRGERAPEP